jgi:hypothetical protein
MNGGDVLVVKAGSAGEKKKLARMIDEQQVILRRAWCPS